MSDTFQIKTPYYEGPFEALLDLIEKRKLLINEISLAQIADDYLRYLKSLVAMPLRDTANFLLVASTLILLKSRSLLPSLSLTSEEEHDISDLEFRLKLYERYRSVSQELRVIFGKKILFDRGEQSGKTPVVFAPDPTTTIPCIHAAIRSIISSFPQEKPLPAVVVRRIVTIEEIMDRLRDRVATALKVSFREFVGKNTTEKKEVIVGFLALLELVKQGVIDAIQNIRFEDISLESQHIDVPRYHS
ncbi:MAG: segregation and condensation protein A [Minisyncoccota bacterium]